MANLAKRSTDLAFTRKNFAKLEAALALATEARDMAQRNAAYTAEQLAGSRAEARGLRQTMDSELSVAKELLENASEAPKGKQVIRHCSLCGQPIEVRFKGTATREANEMIRSAMMGENFSKARSALHISADDIAGLTGEELRKAAAKLEASRIRQQQELRKVDQKLADAEAAALSKALDARNVPRPEDVGLRLNPADKDVRKNADKFLQTVADVYGVEIGPKQLPEAKDAAQKRQ